MKVSFLGGADEVGASCVLVEAAGERVLVDCGVRMGGAAKGDRLPDLAAIGDTDSLTAVVLTHAHLDHTGALPLLHATGTGVPVFATAATLSLLEVLLRDASKIMEEQCSREDEIPLYPPEAVDTLLALASAVPFLERTPIGKGTGWEMTLLPAGHILGAALVALHTPEGTVLVTGDLSVGAQLTVPGAMVPRLRPDLVICEATYGGRLHANRALEEKRFVATVSERLADGGKVLVPAFALGRAQEVLVILERAMRRGHMAPAPVWVDGMVRPICDIYARYAELLTPPLRKRIIKRGEDPFYGDGAFVGPVRRREQRDEILSGPPCVIVSSSGMLSGGPSVYYAARLLGGRENLVTITGYQDEEAPGRRLADLASGSSRSLALAGEELAVQAQVSTYALSAHADEGELVSLLSALRPKDVVFVHGSGEARRRLARATGSVARRDIHLPELGDSLEFTYRARPPTSREPGPREGIGGRAPLDDGGLERLWLYLVHREGTGRNHTVGSLLSYWYGDSATEADRANLVERLAAGKAGFEPDRKRPFLVRLVEPEPASQPDGPLDQANTLEAARRRFAGTGDFVRCGIDGGGRLVVHFSFPLVAQSRHAGELETLSEETGRDVIVHGETKMGALVELVSDVVPDGLSLARNPSVLRDERRVKALLRGPSWAPFAAALEGAAEHFRAETGFTLEFHEDRSTAVETTGSPPLASGTPLEINAAFSRITAAFAGKAHQPTKTSKKSDATGPFIEVSFISPAVGERYRGRLAELARTTGWDVRLASRVDQMAIIQTVRTILAPLGPLTKSPGVHLDQAAVKVRMTPPPTGPALEKARTAVEEATGFTLVIE